MAIYLRFPDLPSRILECPSSAFCYALAALLHLDHVNWFSGAEIVTRTGMPYRYLRHIMSQLATAGVIEGRRGPGGGFRLAKPASNTSVLEVLEAVDGPVAPEIEELPTRLASGSARTLRQVLDGVAGDVAARLRGLKLAELT